MANQNNSILPYIKNATFFKRKDLLVSGFNFNLFDYRANLIFDWGVMLDCKIIDDIAWAENSNGDVLSIDLDGNEDVLVQSLN